jgi:hypothetical protein
MKQFGFSIFAIALSMLAGHLWDDDEVVRLRAELERLMK